VTGHPCEQVCFHAACNRDRSTLETHVATTSTGRSCVINSLYDPPSDIHSFTLCLQLWHVLRQRSPLTIPSSWAVWSATIDPRHPRMGPVVGEATAWGYPHHLQDRKGPSVGEGEQRGSGIPFPLFLFFSFFSLHPLRCKTGPSLEAIKGKDQYLSRGS
jgi:hypothetical protein